LSLLTPDELYTTWQRLAEAFGTALNVDAFASALLAKIDEWWQQLGRALGREQGSNFTPVLAEKDTGRDTAFLSFRDYTDVYVNSPDVAKAAAAVLLVGLIEKYGRSLYNEGYAIETTKLNLLLADLQSDEAQQAIATIGAGDWFTNLQTAQADFESAYQAKVATEAGVQQPLVTESRKQLMRYLGALIVYVDLQSEFNSEVFGPIAAIIDEVGTDMVAIARARRTRQGSNGETEPEPQTA